MDAKPKRRWLRYSIRTLLVAVSIAGAWLAYYVRWDRQRRALRTAGDPPTAMSSDDRLLPFGLRMLNAEPVALVVIQKHHSDADIQRFRALFPEASIFNKRSKPMMLPPLNE